ncbi:hypothetical protein EV189_0447 [Motilibacter rhizosphaerae]|uniref:Secreted protein n=1 Tax=Motilibacter rhizosphaerae TaxID=598652 RepID=A0A4Q7NVD8_9ACTN|nr:DUF6049 family protein [Motilibacter rhizosphaerae]RZS91213.1 hypothetical protein EV189_0447 [Motilibacter rhizosphaerae]
MTRRARAAVPAAAVLGALLLVGPLGAVSAAPASAPGGSTAGSAAPTSATTGTPPAQQASVVLRGVSPQVTRPGEGVTITGSVVASVPLTEVSVRVWLRRDVPAPAQLSTARTARRAEGTPVLQVPLVASLAADGSARFRVTLPADRLAGGPDVRVRLVYLEVRARSGAGLHTAGVRAVPLPWAPAAEVQQATSLAVVVPFTSAARRTADGAFLDDGLVRDAAPGGRLRRLLAAADGQTLAVDPMVAEDLAVLAAPGGWPLLVGGRTVTQPQDPDAAALLADLKTRAAQAGAVTLLPYGDVDAAALVTAGRRGDLTSAVRTAERVAASYLAPGLRVEVALPESAGSTSALATAVSGAWSAAGVRRVAAPDTLLPPAQGAEPPSPVTLEVADSATEVPALAVSTELSDALVAPGADPVGTLQDALGATAMHTAELPSRPRGVLLVLPRDWDPRASWVTALRAVLRAPWVLPTTLHALATEPVTRTAVVDEVPAARGALARAYLQQVARHALAGAAFARVLGSTGDAQRLTRAYALEQLRLEARSGDGPALLRASSEALDARESSIEVVVNSRVTVPASGRFPVTLRNTSSRRVRVALWFDGSVRVRLRNTGVVSIAPGKPVTVEIATASSANGRATVQAFLVTPNGKPFGTPVFLHLTVRGAGGPAKAVVGGAAVVFVLALSLRIVRRRRLPGIPERGTGSVDAGPPSGTDEQEAPVTGARGGAQR